MDQRKKNITPLPGLDPQATRLLVKRHTCMVFIQEGWIWGSSQIKSYKGRSCTASSHQAKWCDAWQLNFNAK